MRLLLFSFPIRQSAGALDAMGLDKARVRGAVVMRCPDTEYMQSLIHLDVLVDAALLGIARRCEKDRRRQIHVHVSNWQLDPIQSDNASR